MIVLRFVGRALRAICLVVGAVVLVTGVSSCVVGVYVMDRTETVEPLSATSALVVRLDADFGAANSYSLLDNPFAAHALGLVDVLNALDHARTDPKIKSIVMSIRGADLTMANVQELRQAITAIRAAGKKTIIFAPSYDSLAQYYLASAFETVWLQPVGVVTLDGFGGEMPFFKGLMDKLGVRANFIQRKEYKSVMEPFLHDKMSEPARTNMADLFNDIAAQVVADIGADRKAKSETLWDLINRGILTGDEAKQAGLIDVIGHSDEIPEAVRKQLGVDVKDEKAVDFVSVDDYLSLVAPTPKQSILAQLQPKQSVKIDKGHKYVARITIEGTIYAAHERGGIMDETGGTTADDWADAITDATDDDQVSAILVRIDSPGGTPSGSEDIRRALELAQKKGKPVIVSMGSVAASGGYWVATAGDIIFADAATLTGSIGVVGGKFDVEGLSKILGVTWDGVSIGSNVNINAPNTTYSDSERARMNVLMDDVYGHFTGLVAKSRHLDADTVEQLARGRVYTGRRAKEIGLVDQIGGYQDAVAYVAKTLKVEPSKLVIDDYPEPLSPVEELVSLLKGQVMVGHMMTRMMGVLAPSPRVEVMANVPSI